MMLSILINWIIAVICAATTDERPAGPDPPACTEHCANAPNRTELARVWEASDAHL